MKFELKMPKIVCIFILITRMNIKKTKNDSLQFNATGPSYILC